MQNDMNDFKVFLDTLGDGHALFISPNSGVREQQQVDMLNAINERGEYAIVQRASRQIRVGLHVIHLAIAHRYLAEQMQGMEFKTICGLEHLDHLDNGRELRQLLETRIRT